MGYFHIPNAPRSALSESGTGRIFLSIWCIIASADNRHKTIPRKTSRQELSIPIIATSSRCNGYLPAVSHTTSTHFSRNRRFRGTRQKTADGTSATDRCRFGCPATLALNRPLPQRVISGGGAAHVVEPRPREIIRDSAHSFAAQKNAPPHRDGGEGFGG